MTYMLNDRQVHEALHHDVKLNQRKGIKSFLLVMESGYDDPFEDRLREVLGDKSYCLNCEGVGKHGVQILTGGPFTDANDKKHVTWYREQWYSQKPTLYICPVCNGSGLLTRATQRTPEPVL